MGIGLVNVVANGPCAKNLDPRELSGLTIGMNAAYRYWETINWQPDFYACLDAQAIHNHLDWVAKSISENKIKGFFLHSEAKGLLPALDESKTVYLNDVRKIGFSSKREQNIFKSPLASFVTTGSWAIRYAAHLGATEIKLYGFDLKYNKTVSKKHGILRRQATQETSNQNYFFDGYQLPGDKFNEANPWFIPFDLHKFAVLSAIKEVARIYPHIKIQNFGGHPEITGLLDSYKFRNGDSVD